MSTTIVTPNTTGRRKRRTRSQAQSERSKRRKVGSSEKGTSLVGACFDKRFIGYGTWTATIDAYDSKTKKYTCRYVDGYLEFHTREKLEKYGLFRPEEGEVVEANMNPDEHPALRKKTSRTNGSVTAASTTDEPRSVGKDTAPTTVSGEAISTPISGARRNNEILLSDSDDEADGGKEVTSTSRAGSSSTNETVDLTVDENPAGENNDAAIHSNLSTSINTNEDVLPEPRTADGATVATSTNSSQATPASSSGDRKKRAVPANNYRSKRKKQKQLGKAVNAIDVKPEPVAFGMADIPPDVIELSEKDFYGPVEWGKLLKGRYLESTTSTTTSDENSGASTTSTTKNDDEDIVFIGSTDNLSSYDLPHSRKDCPVEKYQPHFVTKSYDSRDKDTPAQKRKRRAQNIKICPKCYCVICEMPAQNCKSWSTGSKPHCNAELGGFDNQYWQKQKVISSNILLRDHKAFAEVATPIISSGASTVKALFTRYRRGQEVYHYVSDDEGYGFFGMDYTREFSHMMHDFDDILCHYDRKLEETKRWFKSANQGVSSLYTGIGILDTLTEQLGRHSWSPSDCEVRSVGDKWDADAEKKYQGLVIKLGAQWLRLVNPGIFGAASKSNIGNCPVLKRVRELCMSTNKCPAHCLSIGGLKKHFSGRTTKRLKCPYPGCTSLVLKYDYKDRKKKLYTAGDYEALHVQPSLLSTLKLRLKNLLNVAKTNSIRDMLQGLLYDGKVSSAVRDGNFQPYRASTLGEDIPNFFVLVALEQGHIEYAIQQVLSSRNLSMLPVMKAVKDSYLQGTGLAARIHAWDLLNICLLGTDICSDVVDILRSSAIKCLTKSQADVAEYILGMRCFFGNMKDSGDSADSNSVINLVDEDANSSSGVNTTMRNVRFGRGNSDLQEHDVVEVVANFNSSTLGLDIKAGPFGRIYVVSKKATGASKTKQGDDVERNKIADGDLIVSVNGKHVANIRYDGGSGSTSIEGSKCSGALVETSATIKSCNSPFRIILERPSYITTLKCGSASFKSLFCRQFFDMKFGWKVGKQILHSYNDRHKGEELALETMQQGTNSNIIQMLLFCDRKDAVAKMKCKNICFLQEMMFASAARFIMTAECPRRLAKQYAKDFKRYFSDSFYQNSSKAANIVHRLYRFLYWCSKYCNVATDFGKAFLAQLCTVKDDRFLSRLFPMSREYKPKNGTNTRQYIRFDINVPKAKLHWEKNVERDRQLMFLEKFDINLIRIILENFENFTTDCLCLLYQLRSYEIHCDGMGIEWCTDGFKEHLVEIIASGCKTWPISMCQDLDRLWDVSPFFLKSDPTMKFLNFCWRFRMVFDKSGNLKDGREYHLNTFPDLSELKKLAKVLDNKFVKETLTEMMKAVLSTFQYNDDYWGEDNWLRGNSEKVYDAQIRGIIKVLHFLQLEYKMEVSQHIRSLMAAPYKVRRIPGYPTSDEEGISRPTPYASSNPYKLYSSRKVMPYTILKLKFVASVLKNESGQYTLKQQNTILNEFAPAFKALMKNSSVKKMLPHTWSIVLCARKRRDVWLKAIGVHIEDYHVKEYLEKLKLRRLKTSCSPMFNALKANKMSSWQEKHAYKVNVLVQRNSATRMGISFASICCNTKSPTSKKGMFALAVSDILDEFMVKKVNGEEIFGFHPDLGKSVFKQKDRQVKVGDILYKIGTKKVLGKDPKEVRDALKKMVYSKSSHNYNGVLRSKIDCIFLRKFEDTETFLC